MIPFQGLIASVIGIVALILAWQRPVPILWYVILGLLIIDFVFKKTVRESMGMYGLKDSATVTWGIITTVNQVAIIGLSVYVIFF